jgi:hypothetical protein
MSMWAAACLCTVSEILGSNNSHAAGRDSNWLEMRDWLHMKCPELVASCLSSSNKLGALAAGSAMWLLVTLCECVCVPLCQSDACSCDRTGAKKQHSVVASSQSALAATVSPSSAHISLSDTYVRAQVLCPYCCISRLTAAIVHICTSISTVARPTTIPIPSADDEVLEPDDEYLIVRTTKRFLLFELHKSSEN